MRHMPGPRPFVILWGTAMLALVTVAPAAAQAHVGVQAAAPDSVGGQLVYQVKEGLRGSKGMTLKSFEESRIQIRIVTLDPDDDVGRRTIYSAVWTVSQLGKPGTHLYWTSIVGICGAQRVGSCAADLVADTDKVVSDVQDAVRSGLKDRR